MHRDACGRKGHVGGVGAFCFIAAHAVYSGFRAVFFAEG